MFDSCQTISSGPRCTDVAEKIVQLFGWRQTYNVEKLQRNVPGRSTTRISITRSNPKSSSESESAEKKVRNYECSSLFMPTLGLCQAFKALSYPIFMFNIISFVNEILFNLFTT